MSLTFVMIADLPPGAASVFQQYEAQVLPLLARHGGRLERRLRTSDESSEVHVVSFDNEAGYDSYINDPERQSHRRLLDGLDITQRLLQVTDVPVGAESG